MIRTLVVEDEPLTARAHAEYVAMVPGFTVVRVALNLQEAARSLRDDRVDLVLLDLNLPDGHGLDLLRRVRGAALDADVLAVTSARDVEVVRSAVAQGVVGYVIKPFAAATLRDRLVAYRQYRDGLDRVDAVDQAEVDQMLRTLRPSPAEDAIGKGLSAETLREVENALRRAGPASAAEMAAAVGSSRVTARRYLEHLSAVGRVRRSTRLGGTGRPEVEYRLFCEGDR